jgi:hypothetical protein
LSANKRHGTGLVRAPRVSHGVRSIIVSHCRDQR